MIWPACVCKKHKNIMLQRRQDYEHSKEDQILTLLLCTALLFGIVPPAATAADMPGYNGLDGEVLDANASHGYLGAVVNAPLQIDFDITSAVKG